MVDDFLIHVFRYFRGEAHSNLDNLGGVEARQVAQNLIWAAEGLVTRA